MNKISVYLYLYLMASAALATPIVLDNKTNYPAKNNEGKIAIQWAASAEAIQERNRSIINGSKLDSRSLKTLSQKGQIELNLPNQAQYFRVVVWSTDQKEPDLLTNWVNIVPNKTYILNQDQLASAVLVSGAGC
ncbi:hypothetical protein OQJ19_15040 [Fluoribacter gormanii]|uniref:Uncharacterized protein n=1 Tax=Fluoribacter gormanii TaxID=464 RepID=A0A377GK02_9GAMM|nr:hypothetical protein [Fluoribacter gormanii]KTD00787.1 hypothetical protein Lgor_2704 [Fluoribacter gormanii]MCW8443517.1 hypothetical protein [Fluoribacter gormanii]MCW8471945.1 hypothetical protein [Fluoribacter gormanii]SIQ77206.1 hypothetical protein SAMN05421777_10342 [Fluoribacter gormanii]STO24934.1 Uncharacterised protein [Fluoribacter gormanii]